MRTIRRCASITCVLFFAGITALVSVSYAHKNVSGPSSQTNEQVEKDKKVFEKLESELRSEIDGLLRDFAGASKDVPLPPQVPSSRLESSYDRFKDVTTVTIGMPLHHALLPPRIRADGNLKEFLVDVDIYAAYSFPGQQAVKPSSFVLILKSSSSRPLFGSSPSLIFLVDGQRLRLGNMLERVVYHEQGIVDEFVSVEVPSETFISLANAHLVEAQIGQIEFSLSEVHLNGFRAIASLPSTHDQNADKIVLNRASASIDLGGTKWRGDKFSAEFKRDHEVILEGWFAERIGTWKQTEDRVELTLPSANAGHSRILGIAIVKAAKMAIKFKVQSAFGGSTVTSVMQMAE